VADRGILFGGVVGGGRTNDETWEYRNGTWNELDPPNSPEGRKYASAAFDRVRGRLVLYGGFKTTVTIDPDTEREVLTDSLFRDTWEFDGTTWTKTGDDGPDVISSVMVYDGTRDEVLLIGMKTDSNTVMYRYTYPGWEQMTPAKLPACVSGAAAVWQRTFGNVLLYGGACNNGFVPGLTVEWDGTNWAAVDGSLSAGRLYGHAMVWDDARGEALLFGGSDADLGLETNGTYRYRGRWISAWTNYVPGPRSLFGFTTDPDNGIWLYGGVRGSSDLWKYAYGRWTEVFAQDAPASCSYAVTSYDSDRKVTVVVCADASTYEFDGTKWKAITRQGDWPSTSIQASMVYDAAQKKTILFGGYNGNYIKDTWTWDGAKWTQVKGKEPHYRGLAAMFYDPISKKVVLYGGIGRETRDGTLLRFGDTWTFNGKDWVEATGASSPSPRYGAAVAYNPADNRVHMFGGVNEKVEFVAEHFVWDGAKWSKVEGGRVPPARQNARLGWDPTLQQFVLYGGFGGYYFSDLWILEGSSWRPEQEEAGRRRSVTLAPGVATGSWLHRAASRR
jgi:hypothetical protein